MQRITLEFDSEKRRKAAAQFIAELVRQGVGFEVLENGAAIAIEFNGSF